MIGTRTQQVNSHHRSRFNHYHFHSLIGAVFWYCPKPYILVVYRISLDTYSAKSLFQKSYTTIYDKKAIRVKCFFTYYVTKCNSVVLFPHEKFKSLICIHTVFLSLYYIIFFIKVHFIIWCFLPFYPTLHH